MSAPFFIFKNISSLDMNCIIENELPEITPAKRETETTVTGRSGELTQTFNDYDSYDYPVSFTILDYEKIEDVKRWLRGSGQLITHNDLDKYRTVKIKQEPREYQNEWDTFWTVDVTFRCEPFRRQINEPTVTLTAGTNAIFNNGNEESFPVFRFKVTSGNVVLTINNETFTILSPPANTEFTLNTENGICYADGTYIRTTGEFPRLIEGDNNIFLSGSIVLAEMDKRSLFL
ncbi:phage tail protein [Listeria booriae]|uniref:phage tail protein n=1 Tax=Listeria booriae TaxID=1552123 RepID=UPI001623B610|nr:phage tail protein [Listeria booriae]MBC2196313.1 phage tail protein [Listeria booriae]